jgi:hypothetical protein
VARSGEFTCDRARPGPGSYRVRATYLGTSTDTPSVSSYLRFTLP